MSAKKPKLADPRFIGSWPDHSGNHVIADQYGRLWRIDVCDGTMRLVTVKQSPKAPKPKRK